MRGKPFRFIDFRGGVNTNAAPYLVGQNEARDCRNVVSTTRGSIKKRDGNETFLSSIDTPITTIFGTPTYRMIVVAGTRMLQVNEVSLATTEIENLLTSDSPWEFVRAPVAEFGGGPVYGMNGVDTPRYYDGDSIFNWTASSGTLNNGKYLLYFKNRVYVAGVSASPQTLYFSDLGDPRVWPDNNFVEFEPEDGEPITGLGTIGPYILVFKRNKCWVVYDSDTGANRPLSNEIGCPAHRSIVESPNGTYFLGDDDSVYFTNGSTLKRISDNITPTLADMVAAEKSRACATFYKDHYLLSICTSGTTNNLTLDYDQALESWWIHDCASNDFTLWQRDADDEPVLYSAQPGSTGIIDKFFVEGEPQDNGSNFTAYWKGPWISAQEPYRRKRLRRVHLDGRGEVDAYIGIDFANSESLAEADVFPAAESTNFGGSGTFGGTGTFGDTATQAEAVLNTLGVGRAFSIRLESTSSSDFEVDAITFNFTPRQN